MDTNITSLPQEILQHIFSYLDVQHRVLVSHVSKQWLHASDCFPLLKDICIVFKENNIKNRIDSLHNMSRKFLSFKFDGTVIDQQCISFLKLYQCQFYYLSFRYCHLNETLLKLESMDKLNSCINLKSLEITNSDAWLLFSSLPSLKDLQIIHGYSFTDSNMMALDIIVPSLKYFSLSTPISCDARAYRRFYPKQDTFENNPSNDILSFPAVEHFIRKRSESLTSLCLPLGISSDAATQISKIDNLRLQSVSFHNCIECSDIIVDFCRHQPSLVSIDLSFYNLHDSTVESICKLLPHLQEITIAYCFQLKDCVKCIFQLKSLKKIELTACQNISPSSFSQAVSTFKPMDLQTLILGQTLRTDLSTTELLLKTKYLQYLDLTSCFVSNCTLHNISKSLKFLRHLILKECDEITDDGLTGRHGTNATGDPPLNTKIDDPTLALSNLKGLVELDLGMCLKITDAGIAEAIRFQHLRKLNLCGCTSVTSSSQEVISKQNPCLTTLTMEGLAQNWQIWTNKSQGSFHFF